MSDPFDISKALEGAVEEHLSPEVSRFKIHSEYGTAGDQEKAIEKLIFQLEITHRPMSLEQVSIRSVLQGTIGPVRMLLFPRRRYHGSNCIRCPFQSRHG